MTHPNVFPICAKAPGANGGSGHTSQAPARQPIAVSNRSAVDAAAIAPGQLKVRRGLGNKKAAAPKIGAAAMPALHGPTGEAGAPNLSTFFTPDEIVRRNGDLRPTRHITIRPSWFDELREDWREVVSEIRESPVSHLLVAIGAVALWTAVLVVPTLLGAGR